MSIAIRPMRTRLASLASLSILCLAAAGGARGGDLPFANRAPSVVAVSGAGGGGYWAPLVPLRPAPARYDIYGYPILGPGLVGRPSPRAIGVGCPPALQPAYDPDGNLAGYAPIQYCR